MVLSYITYLISASHETWWKIVLLNSRRKVILYSQLQFKNLVTGSHYEKKYVVYFSDVVLRFHELNHIFQLEYIITVTFPYYFSKWRQCDNNNVINRLNNFRWYLTVYDLVHHVTTFWWLYHSFPLFPSIY